MTGERVREALLYESLIALELEKQGWQVKHIID